MKDTAIKKIFGAAECTMCATWQRQAELFNQAALHCPSLRIPRGRFRLGVNDAGAQFILWTLYPALEDKLMRFRSPCDDAAISTVIRSVIKDLCPDYQDFATDIGLAPFAEQVLSEPEKRWAGFTSEEALRYVEDMGIDYQAIFEQLAGLFHLDGENIPPELTNILNKQVAAKLLQMGKSTCQEAYRALPDTWRADLLNEAIEWARKQGLSGRHYLGDTPT